MRNVFKGSAAAALLVLATGAIAAPTAVGEQKLRIEVGMDSKHDLSEPMRDILARAGVTQPAIGPATERFNFLPSFEELTGLVQKPGDSSRSQIGPVNIPAPDVLKAFNGISGTEAGGFLPPDTTGDVSPAHFFQMVNIRWMLFDKTTGNRVFPTPANGNSFFAGFGGLCETTNRGDPLVLWDDAAGRWIVSQFAFTSQTVGPFLQCVAISQTADPLGAYYRYSFAYPFFNDYGKMGVWRTTDSSQNAYLFSMHEFTTTFQGTSFAAVQRDKMLVGQPAKFIRAGGLDAFGALPFHLEGLFAMPESACPMFVDRIAVGTGYRVWDFCIDWEAGTTTFTNTPTLIASDSYAQGLAGIPQLGSTVRLDDFGNNTMYLAALRAYGPNGPGEATAVINHAVDVGADRAGARWAQFGFTQGESITARIPGEFKGGFESEPPTKLAKRLVDQGTFAPGTEHRWMGSINQDKNGNIGFAYNVGSTTANAQIRHTARARTDAPGLMRDEIVPAGAIEDCTSVTTGAQLAAPQSGRPNARWGDYSTTGIDPSDDCTFWHTNEYYATTSNANWQTRVCSFKLAECGQADFSVEATPTSIVPFCAAPSASRTFNIRAGGLGSFTGTVALSASGFPVGITPTFGSLTLNAGQSTTLTLNGFNLAAPGTYQGTVTGISGAVSRTAAVRFGISAAPVAAPTLTAPANGATGVSIRPNLSWNAQVGAIGYTIELSLSNSFATILETGTSTTNSYTPALLLATNTQYFWRVTPNNYCGVGAVSATGNFTTGLAGACPAGTNDLTAFSDTVDGDKVAWTTQSISGDAAAAWSKRIPPAGTGLATRSWVAGNSVSAIADQRLISPPITMPAAARRPLTLAFDAHHQYEVDGAVNCWDGGFVEISTNAGASWLPLGNQRTLTDAYPGVLSGSGSAGESAWCRQATPGTAVRSIFTLDEFAGQTVQLRFRSVSDDNTSGPAPAGWSIDNIFVKGCTTD